MSAWKAFATAAEMNGLPISPSPVGLASLSTYAFARVLGLRPVGSLVAAVSFAFGSLVYHTTSCCTIWSQLSPFLPMGFLGIELSLRRTTWRSRHVSESFST